jgi:hypothetical protein
MKFYSAMIETPQNKNFIIFIPQDFYCDYIVLQMSYIPLQIVTFFAIIITKRTAVGT